MNKHLIARELILTAKSLLAEEDYDYIYDPDHKKKPGGGYVKTDKGWSKGDKKEEKRNPPNETKPQNQGDTAKSHDGGFESMKDRKKTQEDQTREDKFLSLDNDKIKKKLLFHGDRDVNRLHPDTLDKLVKTRDDEEIDSRISEDLLNVHPKTLRHLCDKYMKKREDAIANGDSRGQGESEYILENIRNCHNVSSEDIEKIDKAQNKGNTQKPTPNNNDEPSREQLMDWLDDPMGKKDKLDMSKLSPETREEVKEMSPEELGKFIGWLKKRKKGEE